MKRRHDHAYDHGGSGRDDGGYRSGPRASRPVDPHTFQGSRLEGRIEYAGPNKNRQVHYDDAPASNWSDYGAGPQEPPFRSLPSEPFIYLEVPIKASVAGGFIGQGGETVSRVRRESRCRIHVRSAPKSKDHQTVELKGTLEQVDTALALMRTVVQELEPGYELLVPNRAVISLEIPPSLVGLVIGKQGSHVRSIRQRTDCYVRVKDMDPGATSQSVNITGSLDRIKQAYAMIKDTIDQALQAPSEPTPPEPPQAKRPRSNGPPRIVPRRMVPQRMPPDYDYEPDPYLPPEPAVDNAPLQDPYYPPRDSRPAPGSHYDPLPLQFGDPYPEGYMGEPLPAPTVHDVQDESRMVRPMHPVAAPPMRAPSPSISAISIPSQTFTGSYDQAAYGVPMQQQPLQLASSASPSIQLQYIPQMLQPQPQPQAAAGPPQVLSLQGGGSNPPPQVLLLQPDGTYRPVQVVYQQQQQQPAAQPSTYLQIPAQDYQQQPAANQPTYLQIPAQGYQQQPALSTPTAVGPQLLITSSGLPSSAGALLLDATGQATVLQPSLLGASPALSVSAYQQQPQQQQQQHLAAAVAAGHLSSQQLQQLQNSGVMQFLRGPEL